MIEPISRETFADWVRSALRQLYDAPSLERHPLADHLAGELEPGPAAAQRLRRLLLDAIAAARPAPHVPTCSPDWRAYRILELRFLDGLSANEAMEALALQKSQFFRDQAAALERIVARLWLDHRAHLAAPDQELVTTLPADPASASLVDAEVQRLSQGAMWEALDAAQVAFGLADVWARVAQAQGNAIKLDLEAPVPVRHASRVMLRQALLNVVATAMEQCPGMAITVSSWQNRATVGLRVRSEGAQPPVPGAAPDQPPPLGQRLETARRLMLLMRGALQLQTVPGSPWEARLQWQARVRNRLLVIDDNQGFIDLFGRYLAGHGWRVLGARNGAEARQIIAQEEPTLITMDVLMPEEDGWDLLLALQTDDATRHIPVIVCSVLQEPQLAYALGAAAYLPKPVSEASLLEALRPWAEPAATEVPSSADGA